MKILSSKQKDALRQKYEQEHPDTDWEEELTQSQHRFTLRQVREAVAKIAHDEVRRALLNDIDIDGQFVCLAILGLIDKEMKA